MLSAAFSNLEVPRIPEDAIRLAWGAVGKRDEWRVAVMRKNETQTDIQCSKKRELTYNLSGNR